MEYLDYEIRVKSRNDVIRIVGLFDVHDGTKNHAKKEFQNTIRYIRDTPHCYAIGGGDLMECIDKSDSKRFDPNNIDPEYVPYIGKLAQKQKTNMLETLSPISHKIIGLIRGNHEEAIHKHYDHDIHGELCDDLYKLNHKIKDLSDTAIVRLFIRRSTETHIIKIYLTHGFGGGRKKGSKVNNVISLGEIGFNCDVFWMGHVHTLDHNYEERMDVVGDFGCVSTKNKRQVFILGGSYMKTYVNGTSGYGQRKQYKSEVVGSKILKIVPFPYKEIYRPRINGQRQKVEYLNLAPILTCEDTLIY